MLASSSRLTASGSQLISSGAKVANRAETLSSQKDSRIGRLVWALVRVARQKHDHSSTPQSSSCSTMSAVIGSALSADRLASLPVG